MGRLVSALVAIVFFLGCDLGPSKAPKGADITGRYALSSSSRAMLVGKKGYTNLPEEITIDLSADGSFKITNMPDCGFEPFGEGKGIFVNAIGNWRIGDAHSWTTLLDGWPLYFASDKVNSAVVMNRASPYRIFVIVGDPDSGENLEFETANLS